VACLAHMGSGESMGIGRLREGGMAWRSVGDGRPVRAQLVWRGECGVGVCWALDTDVGPRPSRLGAWHRCSGPLCIEAGPVNDSKGFPIFELFSNDRADPNLQNKKMVLPEIQKFPTLTWW
jgi:hypothetical protein